MPFVPRGLEAQKHPLKHRFDYSFGLSAFTPTMNSFWVTLVRSVKKASQTAPSTTLVNPHNPSRDVETGPVCAQMSIIQNMNIYVTMTKGFSVQTAAPWKLSITPFFCSFENKYDAADDDSAVTVASIMQLTKDTTEEDVVPLTTNKLPDIADSNRPQPLSTVNLAEAFDTHYNMTTNSKNEDTAFNTETFHQILSSGTNKGALKACLGRTKRYSFFKDTSTIKTLVMKKFVPRNIRRIVPFTFFGLLFHVPVSVDIDSFYQELGVTAAKPNIGVRVLVRYDEWNEEHDNSMV